MHLPNFAHSNLKIKGRQVIVRHNLRTKTERLNFYIKDKNYTYKFISNRLREKYSYRKLN